MADFQACLKECGFSEAGRVIGRHFLYSNDGYHLYGTIIGLNTANDDGLLVLETSNRYFRGSAIEGLIWSGPESKTWWLSVIDKSGHSKLVRGGEFVLYLPEDFESPPP